MRKQLVWVFIFLQLTLVAVKNISAQSGQGPLITSTRSLSSDNSRTYDFSFSSELNYLVTNGADTDLFDPLTLMNLQIMKEEAQPSWNREDIDPDKTRAVVQKVFAMQTAKNMMPIIRNSELGDFYKAMESTMRSFTQAFNYSVQKDGDSIKVGKAKQGKKIMELKLSISPRQGLDPQIRFGENVRLRYDWINKQSMLEFGFSF